MKKILLVLAPILAIIAVLLAVSISNTLTRKSVDVPESDRKTTIGTNNTVSVSTAPRQATPTLEVLPDTYTVKTVSSSHVIIDGPQGEMVIQNIPQVKVYTGNAQHPKQVEFSALEVNQKVKIERIFKVHVSVYIIQ